MKASFVNEVIRFERGMGPKESLRLGTFFVREMPTNIHTKNNKIDLNTEDGKYFSDLLKKYNLSYKFHYTGPDGAAVITYKGTYDNLEKFIEEGWGEGFEDDEKASDYITESIRFERGMDPKDSLDIGLNAIRPWERELLGGLGGGYLKFDEAIKFLRDPELAMKIITDLKRQPKWTIEYQVHALNNLIKHRGKAELYKDLMPTRPIYETPMRRIFKEMERRNIIRIEREGRRLMVYLLVGKHKYNGLKESLNEFERGGGSPLRSIGIGRGETLKRKMEAAGKWTDDERDQLLWTIKNNELPLAVYLFEKGVQPGNMYWKAINDLIKFNATDLLGRHYLREPLTADMKEMLNFYQRQNYDNMTKERADYFIKKYKALNVGESIDFERGKDPKEALKIGIESQLNNPDRLDDILEEMSMYLGSAMEVYLPDDKRKEIARMWLLGTHEFKILDQSADEEDATDEEGNLIEPKINYEVADLEAEGWEKFYEENNFGQVEVIMIRNKDKVNESVSFERGVEPKEALEIGVFKKNFEEYIDKFVTALDNLQGKDGFPWASYEDYVYDTIEGDSEIQNQLKYYMKINLSVFDAARKMSKSFDKGMRM
jgi:hypothetical protein